MFTHERFCARGYARPVAAPRSFRTRPSIVVGAAVLAVTLTAAAVYAVVTLSGASAPTNARNGYPGVAMPTHLRPVSLLAPAIAAGPALPVGYTVNGIDISSHDHDEGRAPDWAARKAAGDEFAYIKATEGSTYVNPYYKDDFAAAKSS